MRWRWLLLVPVIGLAWLACGGTTSSGGDGGSGDGGAAGCPASFPTDGTSCSTNGRECEYANTNEFCSRVTSCNAGTFTHSDGICGMPPGGACPASKAAVVVGSACTAAALCEYPDGRCGCVVPPGPVMVDGGAMTWKCTAAPANCPAVRPLLGSSCSAEGQTCDYGACALGGNGGYGTPLARRCTGGVWTRTATPCPK